MTEENGTRWVETYRNGLEWIEELDGVDWIDAPVPRRWHRCKMQLRGSVGGGPVARCACGAISCDGRNWLERNSRRDVDMRISRPCYDKFHRCPGWAGGGIQYAKRDRCDGGSLTWIINYDRRSWKWRTYTCPTCGVLVLPYMIRYVDPSWYMSAGRYRFRMWLLDRKK